MTTKKISITPKSDDILTIEELRYIEGKNSFREGSLKRKEGYKGRRCLIGDKPTIGIKVNVSEEDLEVMKELAEKYHKGKLGAVGRNLIHFVLSNPELLKQINKYK